MNNDDLNRLKSLPVPPPSETARATAIGAALAAFNESSATSAEGTKGVAPSHRLKDASSTSRRSTSMRLRPHMAIAASIAVLTIAAPIGVYLLSDGPSPSLLRDAGPGAPTVAHAPQPQEPAKTQLHIPGILIPDPQATGRQQREDGRSINFNDTNLFDIDKYSGHDVAAQQSAAQTTAAAPVLAPSSPGAGGQAVTGGGKRKKRAEYQLDGMVATLPMARSAEAVTQYNRALSLQSAQKDPNLRLGYLYPSPGDQQAPQKVEEGRDRFDAAPSNPVRSVVSEPVSTFSIDVDTASYGFVRRSLASGRLPQRDAVRVEELINYFPYSYPLPQSRTAPFQPTVTVLPSPWNPANKLVHIAIKGYDVVRTERPRANLVLLIDTSGSMQPEDRLPLLKNAFLMFIDTLQADDSVGIVTYAGDTRVALEPTKLAEKQKIVEAISKLDAGGSTAGAAGIQRAYRMAEDGFDKAAVNRVILATDGDFNVGITNQNELKSFIERKRQTGVFLSILGVGRGNYNDALMQTLAQNGNGAAAYIDTLNEARKVLVEESSSTLFPIAKDVKIQLEFNPARVSEYRLIGYETRILRREDFANDKVDAGDIGSGHSVTAIYEITPVGAPKLVEDLRYGAPPAVQAAAASGDAKTGEYAFLKIRYKLPKEDTSRLIEFAVTESVETPGIDQASTEVRFSTAVAAFGQLLRGEPHLKTFGFDEVVALANGAKGDDPFGYRAELANLARMAKSARP